MTCRELACRAINFGVEHATLVERADGDVDDMGSQDRETAQIALP